MPCAEKASGVSWQLQVDVQGGLGGVSRPLQVDVQERLALPELAAAVPSLLEGVEGPIRALAHPMPACWAQWPLWEGTGAGTAASGRWWGPDCERHL